MNAATAAAVDAAARLLGRFRRGVALTGAGVSTGSGIPDFRSATGLWERYPPVEYATLDAFVQNPAKVWRMLRELGELTEGARPNPGHVALAQLERRGILRGVVTQNIDGLHQAAGSRQVVEFHGNATRLHCLGCGAELAMWRRSRAIRRGETPRCRCGNALKPKVVLFGEMLPLDAVMRAQAWIEEADLLLLVGTSAQVAPASELPLLAKAAGATVVEFNLEASAVTELVTDLLVPGPAEQTLPALINALR